MSVWSRRKLAAKREAAQSRQDEADLEKPSVQETGVEADDSTEPSVVDDAYIQALPPIDEITAKTDLGPFMKRGVPIALRNAAMRKMWMTNALIRDLDDPAVDYAWDWNSAEGVPGAGKILNRDNVAKMVDDLVNRGGPSEDAPEEESTAESTPDFEDQSQDSTGRTIAVDTGTQKSKEPMHTSDTAEPTPQQQVDVSEPDPAAEDRSDPSEDRPRHRRHGGALPE